MYLWVQQTVFTLDQSNRKLGAKRQYIDLLENKENGAIEAMNHVWCDNVNHVLDISLVRNLIAGEEPDIIVIDANEDGCGDNWSDKQ